MPQFDIENFPSQIFWLIVFFGLMYLVNYFIFLPKFSKILNKRSEKILSDNASVQNYEKEIESLNLRYKNLLLDLEKKISRIKSDYKLKLTQYKIHESLIFEEYVSQIEKQEEENFHKFQKDLEAFKGIFSKRLTTAFMNRIFKG